MARKNDISILEKVAAALETGKKSSIQKIGAEFVSHISAAAKESTAYVWGMGEPLFVIAQQLTDRNLRLRAYRLVTKCADATISASLKAAHEKATELFLCDAGLIEDPIKRFNIYLDQQDRGSIEFRRAVSLQAIKLVPYFPEGAERIAAYDRFYSFVDGETHNDSLLGIAAEIKHVETAKARVSKLYSICGGAREMSERVRRQLGMTYLANVMGLSDVSSRTWQNLYAFRHFKLPKDLKVLAMDTVIADIDTLKEPEAILEHCKKLLDEVPNSHNPGYEAYHPHRLKAVETILKHVAAIKEFETRIDAYCEAVRYADKGSAMEKQALDGLASDIAIIPDPAERRKTYYEIARHGGPVTEKAMVAGWKKEMEALPTAAQIKFLKDSMHELFASGGEPFQEAYQDIFKKGVAAMPDPIDRIYFCVNVAAACDHYAGHGLQEVALEGFRQYLQEIPDKKQRETICWDLMDHDREQTMLPDPPLEQAIHAEWSKLHWEDEESDESKRRRLMKTITARRANLG